MTARQRMDAEERKQELRLLVDCKCVVCDAFLPHDLFDLAHRVNKSKSSLEVWGSDIINHELNMVPTCHGLKAGRSCNDSCNIGKRPIEVKALLDRIVRIQTGREAMPDMREEYRMLADEFRERRES